MTNRDELFALSNAELGKWLFALLDAKEYGLNCGRCPVPCPEYLSLMADAGYELPCSDIIADWLRAEAE